MSAAFVSKSGVGRGHVAGQPMGPEVSFAPVLPPPCRPPRFGEGLDPARVSASCHPAAVGAWRPVLGRVRVRSTSTAHVPGTGSSSPPRRAPAAAPLGDGRARDVELGGRGGVHVGAAGHQIAGGLEIARSGREQDGRVAALHDVKHQVGLKPAARVWMRRSHGAERAWTSARSATSAHVEGPRARARKRFKPTPPTTRRPAAPPPGGS